MRLNQGVNAATRIGAIYVECSESNMVFPLFIPSRHSF